ncbi:MAG: hypothetical protein JSU06_17630 [Actinobacteria bacterium]|nr:hypothetical protein [Actinomycetota bacterium]
MPVAMIGDSGYKIALFFHIFAVVALGPTFAYGILFSVLPKYPRSAPALLEGMRRIDRYMVNTAMVVLLIAGIILLATSGSVWSGSDFFVVWGFIAIIGLFGLQHGFFAPQMRKLQGIAERDLAAGDTVGAELDATSRLIARVGGATGLLIVVTIFIMVYKPFM